MKLTRKQRHDAQITYVSGLRVSKAVLTNYANGRYNDETLIKHIVKYNERRGKRLFNFAEGVTVEDWLRADLEYYNTEYQATNAEKLEAIFNRVRAKRFWKDFDEEEGESKNAYISSVEETLRQIPVEEQRKIKKEFGNINWDKAYYEDGKVKVNNDGFILELMINNHKAGDYTEDSLTWVIRK